MTTRLLVHIDFGDATQTTRNRFAARMRRRSWIHYPYLANAFCTEVLGENSEDHLLRAVRADLKAAARSAGLEDDTWSATCVVEGDEPSMLPIDQDTSAV